VGTTGSSGSYVVDRRSGERRVLATAARPAPNRHEVDDPVSVTCASAVESAVLVLCNPWPGEGLPDDVFATLVADVQSAGVPRRRARQTSCATGSAPATATWSSRSSVTS
jgi:hypothetical protein